MSVQFYARRIFQTTAPANMIGHDGVMSINEDCPVGTTLCYDKDDNLYRFALADRATTSAACWPNPTRKGIPLYRDNWRHVAPGANTPYGASFRNARSVTIVECL